MAGFDLGSIFVHLKANTEGLENGLNKAESRVQKFNNFLGDSVAASQKFAAALGVAGGALAVLGGTAVKSASDYQQSRIAFETMLGSAEGAQKLLKQVSDFAQATPFELPQVVTGAKQLLAYGVEAEKLIPTFKVMGDIAAGVGNDKLPDLIRAFGQVRAKGKLMAQELNQFAEAGVPLREMLAKDLGMSLEKFSEDLDKGNLNVKFAEVEKSLQSLTGEGGRFFNLMEKQSKTFGGTVSNIKDQYGRLARDIVGISDTGEIREGSIFARLTELGKQLLDFLNKNGPAIRDQILRMFEWVEKNGPIVAGIIAGGLAPAFVAMGIALGGIMIHLAPFILAGAAIGFLWQKNKPLLFAIAAGLTAVGIAIFVTMLPAIISATVAFGAMAIAVLAATWPFILIGVIVTAAAYLIITQWDNIVKFFTETVPKIYKNVVDWFGRTWQKVTETVKNIYDSVVNWFAKLPERAAFWFGFLLGWIIRFWLDLPKNLLNAAMAILEFYGWLFTTVKDIVLGLIESAINGIIDFIAKLPERLVKFATGLYNTSKEVGKNILDGLMEFVKNIPQAVTDIFNNVLKAIGDFATKAFEGAKKLGGKMWEGFKKGMGISSPSFIERALMAIEDQSQSTLSQLKVDMQGFSGFSTQIAPAIASPVSAAPVSTVNSPVNIKVDLKGVMASSKSEFREVGKLIIESVNEELRAKGGREIGK